jgi:hypothetical protein
VTSGPIFIVGLSFSGKTPLRQALSAHPRLAMTRHTGLWTRYYGRFGDLSEREHLESCLDMVMADDAVRPLAPDRAGLERAMRRAGTPDDLRLIACLHEHHAQLMGKARWGEQLGLLERRAALLLKAFPQAQIIHMLRRPWERMSVAAPRGVRTPLKAGSEGARWLRSVALSRANSRLAPERYLVLRYEELVGQPEATLRQVAAFLGEDYDAAMLAALRDSAVGRAHEQVARGLSEAPGPPDGSREQ